MENHLSPKQWWFLNCGASAPIRNNAFSLFPLGLCMVLAFTLLAACLIEAAIGHGSGHVVLAIAAGTGGPRERLLGTINYKRNGFDELVQGKGGGLASEIYDYFRLEVAGTEEKKSSLNFTVNTGNPFSVLKSIQTRHGSTAWNDITGIDLRQLSHKIHDEYRRAKEVPNTQATNNDATSANPVQSPFNFNMYFPFRFDDMTAAGKRAGAWPVNRYGQTGAATAGLRMYFGNETDLTTEAGVVTTHDIINFTVNVWGRVWTGAPGWESAKFQLYQRTTEYYDVNNVAWSKKLLEIKNQPAQARGFLIYTYTDQPDTPLTTLIPDSASIRLKYNNSDIKYDYTAGYVKAKNAHDYGAPLDNGFYYIDLAEDGDFGRLQDLSAGTYEIEIGSTNQIANAKLRVVTETLAPSL